jgi:hypothetical protein
MAGDEAGVRVTRLARGSPGDYSLWRFRHAVAQGCPHAVAGHSARVQPQPSSRARRQTGRPPARGHRVHLHRASRSLPLSVGERPREEVRRWRPASAGTPRTPMPRAASVSSRAATASCLSRVTLWRSRLGIRHCGQGKEVEAVAGSSRPPESSPRRFRDLDGASGDKTTAEVSMGLGPRGTTTITGITTR